MTSNSRAPEPQTALDSRARLLHSSGQADPDVIAFVDGQLRGIAARLALVYDDRRFGRLFTHCVLALMRSRHGEAITGWAARPDAELAADAVERAEARRLLAAADAELGLALPDVEAGFVALHLAALTARGT
jgi:hypothetical protein